PGPVLVALPLPGGARGAAAAEPAADRRLQLLPGRAQPDRRLDVVLDDVLSAAATNSGMRLVQDYVNGSLSNSAFAAQWQALLTSSALAWATQNHVDLGKY